MNRVPLLVLAGLVATTLLAAAWKFRARTDAPTHSALALPTPSARPAPTRPHGMGAGPPPVSVERASIASMIHGDPRHTHRAAGAAPQAAPAVVWSHNVGGAVEAQITSSADAQTLYVASLGGSITALARADGVERWTVSLGDRAYATPCIAADGTIYVGSDAGKLVAISPEGKIKWSLDTDGDADTGPTLAGDGTVIFAAGRIVYAVSPLGQIRWRYAAKRKVFTSPAIGNHGRVYFGSQDHHAYAVTSQGTLVWSVDLGADVDGAPAIGDDGAVFVGTDGDEIVRLDPDNGAVVWRAKLGGYVRGTLSIARGGDVIAGVYGPTPREVRVRSDDGGLVGEFAIQGTGGREFGVHGGALEDDIGTLLFGAQDDGVYAVSAMGDLLWRFSTQGDVDAPLTLFDDGTVIVGSDDGNVYLLRTM